MSVFDALFTLNLKHNFNGKWTGEYLTLFDKLLTLPYYEDNWIIKKLNL